MRTLLAGLLFFVLGATTAFVILSRTGVPMPAVATASPDSARSAWTQFAERMALLGDRVQGADFPSGEADRVRLLRHLVGVMIEGLQWHVDHGSAAHPTLMASNGRFQQWGAPNADNVYYRAHVDPHFDYRLTGDLSGIDHVAISLSTGDMHMGAFETSRNVDVPELAPDREGRFSLAISSERARGPWLAMEPDHRILSVRIYLDDWEWDRAPELFLERVGAEGESPPEFTDVELARRITRAGDWIEANILFWNAWLNQRLVFIPDNASLLAAKVDGGSDDLFYGGIAYELEPDEALMIEGPMAEGQYWSFQRAALGSFDTNYTDHLTSLNRLQVRSHGEGRFVLVVSHRDPGVANWIDTEGQARGLIAHRWIGVRERPDLETRKIRFDELGDVLPSDVVRITSSERRKQIAVRQKQSALRP
ncbi:MAG: hypothetical protein CMJ98_07230 [Planctomycetes bacterium]|nr:hypothetical protein [Planctomycetota bacterium]MCP4905749.1 hypothetical protein [bacterium]